MRWRDVFSCRRLFYRDNLENKLVSRIIEIDVPEWTDPELDELLKKRGTSIAALDAGIVRSLRNPRIFGVAAALFKAEEITAFGELSVSRLLFEHIRSGSAAEGTTASSKQFAADICTHAESIVQRLKQRQLDGLNEFDMPALVAAGRSNQPISKQFVVTSAGRFFEVLDENPNKYVLKDEGLPLALGLALVRTAREALRKQRSVDEALSNILDPIAALDKTGDILLDAILSAVLEGAPKEVVAPLARSFVMLQNLDSGRYPEFRNLFGRDPGAFLVALEDSALSSDIASNLSWLTDSANDLRGEEAFEMALAAAVHRWLNMYSLAPERMMLVPNNPEHAAERQRALAERKQELCATMTALSQMERDLLASMVEENRGDYSQLSLVAFQALARRPLAPFAESLRNWCFAASLNGGYRNHHEDFCDLLHFNLVDWAATKDALREAAMPLQQIGMSSTGRWALVYILRATGDSGDAEEAERIAQELTKDQKRMKGWRRIEDYCATDPCDPASEAPDNIEKTASNYRAINPAELRRFMGSTQEDYFFTDAQPGLARFRPNAAVEVLRAFADQAVTRTQPEFRQAIFLLDNHTVALEDRVAIPYVGKASEIARAALAAGEDKNNEAWTTAQCALSVAFPHMTGDTQFDALLDHPKDMTILLDLGYLFQSIDESKLEGALDKAVREDNSVAQFRILCFAEYSRTRLTARTKEMVVSLLASTEDHVRLSALALIQATADPVLLAGLVKSGWSAMPLDAVAHKVEMFQGSQALVLAAEQGSITLEACLYISLAGELASASLFDRPQNTRRRLAMKPEKMTVLEVFQRERRLCVPLFQRAYVWNSEQQWEPLWEDIVRQANMHMVQTDPHAIRTHFLGAIVINIASVQGRSVARADVIDGQQRLTTLQLFMAALRDVAKAHDADPDDIDTFTRHTENPIRDKTSDEVFKCGRPIPIGGPSVRRCGPAPSRRCSSSSGRRPICRKSQQRTRSSTMRSQTTSPKSHPQMGAKTEFLRFVGLFRDRCSW